MTPELKSFLEHICMPLPMSVLLVLGGLIACKLGRRRLGGVVLVGGITIGLSATLGPVANSLLYPLETRYPPVVNVSSLPVTPKYVAVLGSGYLPRAGLPDTAAIDAVGIVRLTEGVRLYRELPGSQLIVSGGPMAGQPPSALGYSKVAIALGVPLNAIIMIDTPLDTSAEITSLYDQIGSADVLLVTSASHMVRAMSHARRVGLHAIPAPTGQLATPPGFWDVWTWMPSGTHLRKTEIAVHEYLGLLALTLGRKQSSITQRTGREIVHEEIIGGSVTAVAPSSPKHQ